MFYSRIKRNILNFFMCSIAIFACLFLGIFLTAKTNVYAAEGDLPSYLSISNTTASFTGGDTIFLAQNEVLNITLGKPQIDTTNIENGTGSVITSQDEIGAYALDLLETTFLLKIDNIEISSATLKEAGLLKFFPYTYQPTILDPQGTPVPSGQPKTFMYMTLKLDLSHVALKSGEYTLSFTNYIEYSGPQFAQNDNHSFSFTIYVFNTTEYFATENATTPNANFENVETAHPNTLSYRNYYYFNYSNQPTAQSFTASHLPTLSFDASKFIVNISKTVAGNKFTTQVSKFNENLITLGQTTQSSFVKAFYDETSNQINIIFNDLGEYVLEYTFVYERFDRSAITLSSLEIDSVLTKNDVLYIFGYQMYYGGEISTQSEFKAFEDNFLSTKQNLSADVTYLIDNSSLIKSTDPLSFETDDATLKNLITTKNITPVSTNQPAVILNSNASLVTAHSTVTHCTYNQATGYHWGEPTAFVDTPFTSSGTYLVKLVYNYDYYYSGTSLASNTFFVQYFFFTIDNTVPSSHIFDESGRQMANGTFTNLDATVSLDSQSIFNSPVQLQIFSKNFAEGGYSSTPDAVLTAGSNQVSQTFSAQGNYLAKLLYGKNLSKSKSTYFTIDKTDLSGITIRGVDKNSQTGLFEKNSSTISFFTSQNVVVEWNEKSSGAKTQGYFKYIPFTTNTSGVTSLLNTTAQGIVTTQTLNLDPQKIYDKSSYTNALDKITSSNVFSNPGLYIIYITDEAGHEKYISFCIDRSQIQVLQIDPSSGEEKFMTSQDLISSDKTLRWGYYKLVPISATTDHLTTMADPWIKNTLSSLYSPEGLRDGDNVLSHASNLYFSVDICKVYGLQTGTNLALVTNNPQDQTQISIMSTTSGGIEYANEITYSYFFIDETNPLFSQYEAMFGQNASSSSVEIFATNADRSFQITTSTDASNAQLVLNNTSLITDVTLLSGSPTSLLQAGFADSSPNSSTDETPSIRTKYYFATGPSFSGTANIISYKIKLKISDTLSVSNITMLHYAFVVDPLTGQTVLSKTASRVVLYDAALALNSSMTEITDPLNPGYYATNLNVEYDSLTNTYRTLAGKYVIIRTYDNPNHVNKDDFSTRESVFIVDRGDIVSSPENFGGETLSQTGGGIFVNVLDGHTQSVQFKNIYAAKNNTSTYILQTNKLPVVVYVPVSKFGAFGQGQDKTYFFNKNSILSSYMEIDSSSRLIRYSYIDGTATNVTEKSYLHLVYFGSSVLTENFDKNPDIYKSTDFDLTVTITSSNGQSIQTTMSSLGYITSSAIMQTGIYTVTITQNAFNGKTFPNVYNTFSFSFQIIESPPTFVFTSEKADANSSPFDTDPSGTYYTNSSSLIKVVWTNPVDTKYFAKVDTTADASGNTKIYYYFSSTSGEKISRDIYLKASDIQTDLSSPSTKYFLVDLSTIPDNSILNVYMQNERGTVTGANAEILQRLTSATKNLYVDRSAPSQILDTLISATTLEGIRFADYSRKYVNLDGTDAISGSRLYSVPLTSGALAKYAFAVTNSSSNPLSNLFTSKAPINGFYTEGYYYHIEKISDIAQYSPKLDSAIATAKTYHSQSAQSFSFNTYYAVTEVDLAGNAAIYLIFVTDNDNKNVLQFDREKTDIEHKNHINYDELVPSQNIYAKTFLNITNIALHSYAFLEFSLDGEIYFTSTALAPGQCYKFSSMTSSSALPEILSISDLLSFTAPSTHTLRINDSIKNINYEFKFYITNQMLSYSLLSTGEGLTITTPIGPSHFLSSIKISSYDKDLDKYVSIYDQSSTVYTSNPFVTVRDTSDGTYTFTIIKPELAYSYVFYDNYGQKYVEHHTAGSFVLDDKDKVKNHYDEVLITEVIEDQQSTNPWFVSGQNVIYNYSSADYYAYIKIYMLTVVEDIAMWTLVTSSVTNPYGVAISQQSNYSITHDSSILCTVSQSPLHQTVKQLLLYAPSSNALSQNFTGGAYKFEITLVDQYDSSSSNRITDRILINNLSPIIDLRDKNYESVFSEDSIYSEQLTVIVPSLPASLTSNSAVAPFLLPLSSQIVFNQTESNLISGTIVEEAGSYEVKVYVKVNDNYYLINSKSFIISASQSDFYQVLVRDSLSGTYITASSTGKAFTMGSIVCYNHFIVNDEFDLFVNKNQFMESSLTQTIPSHECVTYIYEISNFKHAASNNISPYQTTIAVSYIPKTTAILTTNLFNYETNDGTSKPLSGTNTYIAITQSDTDVDHITIRFNSFYALPENIITARIQSQNLVWNVYGSSSSQTTTFTLTSSGDYTISFSDVAGNSQLFSDSNGIEQAYFYKIRFIKGVAYLINGSSPIQNAIYNDSVTITLPTTLADVYDAGGKPSIVVLKNDKEISITPQNGQYIINESGYYKVYFNARVKDKELRQEAYEFLIMSQEEYKSSFEFTEYGEYEIISVLKNNQDFTENIRSNYNLANGDSLRTLAISLYDEKTGQGTYSVTIQTNSGKQSSTENGLIPEQFTFNFIIKAVGVVPLTISLAEGDATTNPITIEFNAYDLYEEIGECKIVYGKNILTINQEYLDSLSGSYYTSLSLTETGTHFVQVYSSSDSLLYSYKVTKNEPLNTVSILLIVAGVLVVAGLAVTIILLRKRMKIK